MKLCDWSSETGVTLSQTNRCKIIYGDLAPNYQASVSHTSRWYLLVVILDSHIQTVAPSAVCQSDVGLPGQQ